MIFCNKILLYKKKKFFKATNYRSNNKCKTGRVQIIVTKTSLKLFAYVYFIYQPFSTSINGILSNNTCQRAS